MPRTVKTCAGEYTRTDGEREVRVFFHEHCRGWMAAAEWDRQLYTDILPTMRAAIANADYMLKNA